MYITMTPDQICRNEFQIIKFFANLFHFVFPIWSHFLAVIMMLVSLHFANNFC